MSEGRGVVISRAKTYRDSWTYSYWFTVRIRTLYVIKIEFRPEQYIQTPESKKRMQIVVSIVFTPYSMIYTTLVRV